MSFLQTMVAIGVAASLGSVPRGAQGVVLQTVTLRAGNAPVEVQELTVTHAGLGDIADIERVYVTSDRRRLTRGRTFSTADQSATLRFFPPLMLDPGEERVLAVVADFSEGAAPAAEHRLAPLGPSALRAEGGRVTLSADFSSGTAIVRPRATGAVRVTFLDLLQSLRYGTGRTLARLRLEADAAADQEVVAITLTNDGKATDDDLQHLVLQNARGEPVTNVAAALEGNLLHLTFEPPLRIDRRDQVRFDLKGDIRASRRRTVRFILEEPSDLEVRRPAR